MIRFDYTIHRNEGNEEVTYKPKIKKELNDLTMIEGPNSSGKSTLLNLIAMVLWGTKNKNIKESLRKKINALYSSDHQKVTFELEIKNDINQLLIQAKKDFKTDTINISEIIKNKKSSLSFETFTSKYNLIYDIPENPLQRLNELTNEIKDLQSSFGNKVSLITGAFRQNIDEIKNSKDPKKIEHLKKSVRESVNSRQQLEKNQDNIENEISLLSKYLHCFLYIENERKYSEVEKELKELKKETRTKKKIEKEGEKELADLYRVQSQQVIRAREIYSSLISNLSRLNIHSRKNYLELWKKNDVKRILSDDSKKYILFDGIEDFIDLIETSHKTEIDPIKLKEAKLVKELINLLNNYSSTQIVIPGLDKSVIELRKILEQHYSKYEQVHLTNENYEKIKKDLLELKELGIKIVDIINKINSMPKVELEEEEEESEEEFERKKSVLQQKLQEIYELLEGHRVELIKMHITEDHIQEQLNLLSRDKFILPYRHYDEIALRGKITDLKKQLGIIKENINGCIYIEKKHSEEILRLENKEEHKYQSYADELDFLLKRTQILQQKLLVTFEEYLKMLSKKLINKELTPDQKKYFDAISIYLAKKLKTIRHIDKEYKVKKIDLLKDFMVTENNKNIYFSDFGTGQSQAAYLKTLLNSSDNRKIIALIDEIAMLDDDSQEMVFEVLREHYNKGKLLSAIVVQKGSQLIVKNL